MALPEIEAMSAVATALADLGDDERNRVLRWAAEKYGLTVRSDSVPQSGRGDGMEPFNAPEEMTEEEITAEAPTFEHFAELFSAAQPKTDPDRALVAAYWLQVIKSQVRWQSADLQRELKDIGHAIGNITSALTSNMEKKPQRVIQLRKSGSSRQARKTFKVTHEGLVYVQGMLGHGG